MKKKVRLTGSRMLVTPIFRAAHHHARPCKEEKKGILGGLAKWDNSIGRELDRGSISKRSLGGRSIWLASAFFLSLFKKENIRKNISKEDVTEKITDVCLLHWVGEEYIYKVVGAYNKPTREKCSFLSFYWSIYPWTLYATCNNNQTERFIAICMQYNQ